MKYGVIYNIFINLFILLVILSNLFVMIRYTRRSVYSGFLNQHLIHRVITVHRLYICLWTLFQISNFVFVFLDSFEVRVTHGVITASSPLIICVTFVYLILVHSDRNKAKRTAELPLLEESLISLSSEDMEDMNNSGKRKRGQLIDSLLILNPRRMQSAHSQGKLYVSPDEQAFKFEANRGLWDISDNFKEVLRREVLEYIVKAFDVLFEMHRRSQEDTLIAKATMIDLKPNMSEYHNKDNERTG